MKRIFLRLFFTSDDDSAELDIGWLLLLLSFLNALVIFDLAAFGIVTVSIAGWSFYGTVITMSFIAGTTISRARLIASSRTVADVGKAIASVNPIEVSSDVQELYERKNGTYKPDEEIG